ncbi:MAG: phytoene desaturase [Pseudomonadota bacterium]
MNTHIAPKSFDTATPTGRSGLPDGDSNGGDRAKAIVIGAGFGGLAAAIRLGARGYDVTIVERLEQCGGRASVFRQDGFTFDAGPTIVTAPFVFEELWHLCGKRMEDHVTLKPMDPFYRIRFHDGETFACNGDADFMEAEVARLNPKDLKGYAKFLKESEANYRVGFDLMDKPFSRLAKMLSYVPALAMNRADRSVYGHVKRLIKNEKLRQAFSFHPLFIGGNPMRVTAMYSLIAYLERSAGVHYAMGGTGALVQGMVDLVTGQGGSIRLNTPVDHIVLEGARATGVVLENGETLNADVVVSNADSVFTHKHLLRKQKDRVWSDRKLDKLKLSMSLFVWYFGTDKRYEDVDHHTILMGPRYGDLLSDIFEKKVLADDFSLYLHRPSASDPSVAPEGHDAFYVLAPVPHLEGDTDWEAMAEPYRKRIEQALDETIMPGVGDHVVTSKMMTPLDFRDRLNAPHGAAFGPEPRIFQSGWFRPHNECEGIERLYLVGAGTHPGAGLPGVVTSAKVLDEVVPHAADALASRAA